MSEELHSHPIETMTPELWHTLDQTRDPMGHKGTYGSVGIIGGTTGMAGAALLAGRSALKTGAGRVYVFLAQSHPELAVDFAQPELMLRSAYDAEPAWRSMDAIAIGCGLGQSEQSQRLLQQVLEIKPSIPIVIDADALNILATKVAQPHWNPHQVVLTPHPTEAARLLQTSTAAIQDNRPHSARSLAQRYQAWVVLKGQGTLIASPSGELYQNPTGDVALASAGTGDVLAGFIASLLAQGHEMRSAVGGAVWLHGAAGQHLRQQLGGPIGCTASDVIEALRLLRNQPALRTPWLHTSSVTKNRDEPPSDAPALWSPTDF